MGVNAFALQPSTGSPDPFGHRAASVQPGTAGHANNSEFSLPVYTYPIIT